MQRAHSYAHLRLPQAGSYLYLPGSRFFRASQCPDKSGIAFAKESCMMRKNASRIKANVIEHFRLPDSPCGCIGARCPPPELPTSEDRPARRAIAGHARPDSRQASASPKQHLAKIPPAKDVPAHELPPGEHSRPHESHRACSRQPRRCQPASKARLTCSITGDSCSTRLCTNQPALGQS